MSRDFDASDPEQVKQAKVDAGRRKQLDENVVKLIMGSVEGRSWIFRKLEACHIFGSSFDPNNPHVTSFNEGERNVGARLLAEVTSPAVSDLYLQMMKESREDG